MRFNAFSPVEVLLQRLDMLQGASHRGGSLNDTGFIIANV